MQAVCTCFLHEIPLAPNSVYVNRMGSNFVTAPNVRSGLYKPVVQKNPPLQLISLARRRWFLYDRDVFDALLRSWIILFYKPRVFWFLRIGKQFGDNKKTRSGRNLMLVRSTCRLISTNVNFTFNVTTSHNNRFFTNLDPISFPANTRRSKYDYQLGVSCHSSTSSRTNGKCKRH